MTSISRSNRPPPGRRYLSGIAAAALAVIGLPTAHAETIVGLTQDWQLVSFDSSMPTNAAMPVSISGLQMNETLLGIDYRPSTGVLYGLGSSSTLYTLNATTGAATAVASLTNATGGTPFALSANAAYGIDFNPVPDLGQMLPSLRVTSSNGDNLRINVNGASAGQVSVDTSLSPGSYSIAGSAYSNNDRDPTTGTALYNIDFANDALVLQGVPNNGVQSFVGSLGVNTSALVGFDISGASGLAFASLTNNFDGKSSIYNINLATGAASLLGQYGVLGNTAIAASLIDISVGVSPVPEPASYALMLAGLAAMGTVMRRRRNDPA